MLLNDFVANRKSQARADAHTFRREAGVKDLRQILLGNSNARVGDGNPDRIALFESPDCDGSTLRNGLRRVDKKIHENLIKSVRMTLHARNVPVMLHDLNSVLQLML